MKRTIYLALIFFMLLATATPAIASPVADEGQPEPQRVTIGDEKTYLPLAMMGLGSSYHTVSGRITNQSVTINGETTTDTPLSGVKISDGLGNDVTTDANGLFEITTRKGANLTPSLSNYYFYPSSMQVGGDLNNGSFSGASVNAPVAPDAQVIPNTSFEYVPYYWNPISYWAGNYTPYYTSARGHTGSWSGFTGVPTNHVIYGNTWSRWRTHKLQIPATASSVTASLWLWPRSNEVALMTDAETAEKTMAAEVSGLLGINADTGTWPTLNNDFQYVAVVDAVTNQFIDFPYIRLYNNQAWVNTGAISLTAYKSYANGIKLEFGTFNDGDAWNTSTFFDDITVQVDTAAVACSNILLNSDFELDGSWLYKAPQNVPPLYLANMAGYFASPVRSMQAGIAPWDTEPAYNTTTEFFQPFTIPAGTTYAQLRMLVRPRSTNWWGWWSSQERANLQPITDLTGPYSPASPVQTESQYAFIADSAGLDGEWLLFKYFSIDTATFLYRSYDLTSLAGTGTWSVLFGTGDTAPWKTSLFVDEVYLTVCTP